MLYFCKGTKNKGQKTRKNTQPFILTLSRENNVNHQYSVPTIYQRVSRTSIFE